jgi:hypothetical protein
MLYPANVPARLHMVGNPGVFVSVNKGLFRAQFVTAER